MSNSRYIIVCSLLGVFLSCGPEPEEAMLQQALQMAGPNRPELEKVLEHYAGDPLKLEAARFLIKNMPGHCSYADTAVIGKYALAVDSVVESMSGEKDLNIVRDSIDRMARRMGIDTLEKVQDCRIVKADFLIRNIDEAFRDWRQGRWARHIGFEDFCEWILPYKTEELQPLDDWRVRLKAFCSGRLEELDGCDQLCHSPLAAAKVLNTCLADSLRPMTGQNVRHAHIPMEHRARLPFGQCSDYAHMAATILRSHGIPVAVDFTPQWARRSLGHTWNVLIADDGRKVAFGGICDRLGDLHKYEEKMPKVYRKTYSADNGLVELNRSGEYVPPVFRNIFVRDVTKETIQCSDVILNVEKAETGYAYLLVFDNREWVPVTYGKIRRGEALFRDLGQNVMYLPASYTPDGRMKPIAPPFILGYDGNVKPVVPRPERPQDMLLERKYPVMEYAYEYIPRLKDGVFQASNDAEFKTYHVVHRIKEGKACGQDVRVPDSVPPCRYWRYTSRRKATFCSMAEVMFYAAGDTTRLSGKVIGTKGSWGNNPERTRETVFDGDILTAFDAPRGEGCWAGLDLGKPTKVDHIIYYGRGDGNCVEIGDEYELCYWNNDHWERIGRQKAHHTTLKFKGVPSGGLYLLHDQTKGIGMKLSCAQFCHLHHSWLADETKNPLACNKNKGKNEESLGRTAKNN